MLKKMTLFLTLFFAFSTITLALEGSVEKPSELELLKSYVGVWDASIEVWPAGLDSAPVLFTGVETNRAFGEYWIASDFDTEYMGQIMTVHSIVGFDPDQNKMVGTVIDHGPYAASMLGDYDEESKTVTWMTKAKDANGNPLVQKTLVTQKTPGERFLVLMVPGAKENDFTKFMQIMFVKREK